MPMMMMILSELRLHKKKRVCQLDFFFLYDPTHEVQG